MKVSVSILSSKNRIECIKKLNTTSLDYFHIDVMDGKFVDNYQMPIDEINELSLYTKKPLDIHLMVEDPEYYIEKIINRNIEYITFHLEINKDIKSLINKVKEKGYKVGLSIKPNTDIKEIIPYLEYIDLILIMSVEPGQGGQTFITNSLDKISNLKSIIEEKYNNLVIEVDGGINNSNINSLKESGADIVVSGSYIVNSSNYDDKIKMLKI
jgi:ribulose-phosphate 3-epimerase